MMTPQLSLGSIPVADSRQWLMNSSMFRTRFAEVSLEDRYQVVQRLGSGGFADVYKARDLKKDRTDALKLLREEFLAQQSLIEQRFRQEGAIMSRLTHPAIPRLHDIGRFRGRSCLVMAFLEGEDLERFLQTQPAMGPSHALRLVIDVLDALQLGHDQGVVHRDIKPSNLILSGWGTEDARLNILDFGIARRSLDVSRLSIRGTLVGTPRYYSPEYAMGQVVTPALDVYQVGLLLIELLTRQHPVSESTPQACLKVLLKGGVRVPDVFLGTPLEEPLAGALTFRHAERYPDAATLQAALKGVQERFPEHLDEEWTQRFTSGSHARDADAPTAASAAVTCPGTPRLITDATPADSAHPQQEAALSKPAGGATREVAVAHAQQRFAPPASTDLTGSPRQSRVNIEPGSLVIEGKLSAAPRDRSLTRSPLTTPASKNDSAPSELKPSLTASGARWKIALLGLSALCAFLCGLWVL